MTEPVATSYDEIPYSCTPFAFTTPVRLAALARLHGLESPPPERCRVLELGCGLGGNLVPMALLWPRTRFVGIDLSERQIAMGRETAQALALDNLELRAQSILDLGPGLGTFDYIICHGVYSWVPPAVQEGILAVCSANLADNGVACVSYNTYPGWHIRGMIREMMGYHVQQFAEPRERIRQARAILDFLIHAVGDAQTTYGGLLQAEADLLQESSDTYLFHEHLEEVNHPLYFHEFMERAAARGLQYLDEGTPLVLTRNLAPDVARVLEGLSTDPIRAEQYRDFVRGGMFRKTLLCHAAVPLSRAPLPGAMKGLYLTGEVRPVPAADKPAPADAEAFETMNGRRLTTNNPLLRAALHGLFAAWPRAVAFGALHAEIRRRLSEVPGVPEDADTLAGLLLQCHQAGMVELQTAPLPIAGETGERPLASPLARLQARTEPRVTNLRHRLIDLDEFDRLVLVQLDGTRDRAALSEVLREAVDAQNLTPEQVREALAGQLEEALYRLQRSALLMDVSALHSDG